MRAYFAFLPLTYQRPGGVWWYRDFCNKHNRDEFIRDIAKVATAIRVTDAFEDVSDGDCEPPPLDAEVIK